MKINIICDSAILIVVKLKLKLKCRYPEICCCLDEKKTKHLL